MERYGDKWIIVKDVKMCDDSEESFDGCGWKSIPIAVVDSYEDAKDFIYNMDNLAYHLRFIDDRDWSIHPDSNENHRTFYKLDDKNCFEGKYWFIKFHFYSAPHYK